MPAPPTPRPPCKPGLLPPHAEQGRLGPGSLWFRELAVLRRGKAGRSRFSTTDPGGVRSRVPVPSAAVTATKIPAVKGWPAARGLPQAFALGRTISSDSPADAWSSHGPQISVLSHSAGPLPEHCCHRMTPAPKSFLLPLSLEQCLNEDTNFL